MNWKALAAGAALLLAACGTNTNPSTPGEAVDAFIEAVNAYDAEAIVKLTAGYADMTEEERQKAVDEAVRDAKDASPIQKDIVQGILKDVTVSEVRTEGDMATATLKRNAESVSLTLRKEKDGTWRVADPF